MGSDLLREVGERWPGTVRILMTGYASIEGTIDAVNRARISAFLKKPLKAAEIDRAIEDAFAFQALAVQQHGMVAELARQRAELERLVGLLRLDADGRHAKLVASHEQLQSSAHRDPLTGLLNRRGMAHALGHVLRAQPASARRYCALYLDVDRFKDYNDRRGHAAGDELLRAVARSAESCLRTETGGDLIARHGGEEFVAIVAGVELDVGRRIAERVRRAIEIETAVTVSIGLAASPDHGQRVADILAAADCALYRAKQGGRNRVVCFDGDCPGPADAPMPATIAV
jgi:diguanylate cyclase (GGDEF)-like protein